jgi:L-threonylcarbamoyladenylate synthase
MPLQPREYARELYSSLRRLDAGGFDFIFAEKPPATMEWLAVYDRLNRAAISP